jgi:RimJ/RimL family protein N-acetyltransferase
MKEELIVRPLKTEDAASVVLMLQSQPPQYARFFTPFSFDEETLADILSRQAQDVYMGLYWLDQLIGFFMLRGWDAGYEVPSFGILIDEKFRGYGLEMLSLETAKIICRLRGVPRLMIKMHPDNISAKGVARKIGFTLTGNEAESGNLIYHFEIKGRTQERKTGDNRNSAAGRE